VISVNGVEKPIKTAANGQQHVDIIVGEK
jgi:hypothetical protein